ncbi:MAG: transposase [Candidatus Cloacimonadota bacterium]|nr:transposase [Candidatus Cloacimonadota bacterium]
MIHNRKRNRLAGYDYATPGYYFVTICTKGMLEYFGRVQNGKNELNDAGQIVNDRIKWLENHFEYIKIIKFIVMPNHVHFIIQIIDDVGTGRDLSAVRNRTTRELSLRKPLHKIKSLSELVGAFKTITSKLIHQTGFLDFCWQRSFYDHIIRNDDELIRISDYIEKNPMLWKQDEYLISLK